MINILHAFGAGIAFCAGVMAGAWLCHSVTTKRMKKQQEDWDRHYKAVEDRLGKSLDAHVRIADSLEKLTKGK